MRIILKEQKFDYVSEPDKDFIVAFDREMKALGYTYGSEIGSGYCWGRHMIIYSKPGLKSKKVVARIYLRERGIVLRMYFSNIDRHSKYIEDSPQFISGPFKDGHGKCGHCHNEKDRACRFRKSYTIGRKLYEKCNGITFEFHEPDIKKLPGYVGLLVEFYAPRGNRRHAVS